MKTLLIILFSMVVGAFGAAVHSEPLVENNVPIDGLVKTAIPILTALLSQLLAWLLKRREQKLDRREDARKMASEMLKEYLSDSTKTVID